MDLERIKEIGQMITRNFSGGELKVFVFGGTARFLKKGKKKKDDPMEKAFRSPGDLDLLFEVSRKVFEEYAQECYNAGLTFFGVPHDLLSMYWEYYSPAETRWEAIKKVFGIDSSLVKELTSVLRGKKVDIIILPFDWEEDAEIMLAVNSRDPKFSRNIQGDRELLFEK